MERILIVEDERNIIDVLADYLRFEGYEVFCATDGETGLELARNKRPDAIILDLMLPGKDGYDVCRELRQSGDFTPIIILTAKGEEIDKVLGLELGADDYMTKPVGLKELKARIRAVLRRSDWLRRADEVAAYELEGVRIDFKTHEVVKGRKRYPLSTMEAALLHYMVTHRDEVLTRERLLNEVWGYDKFPTTRTVDTHVLNLRRKIEKDPNRPVYILTVHGSGYRFVG